MDQEYPGESAMDGRPPRLACRKMLACQIPRRVSLTYPPALIPVEAPQTCPAFVAKTGVYFLQIMPRPLFSLLPVPR